MAFARRRRPRPASGSRRRKYCYFCKEKVELIDYKDFNGLRRYMSDRAKIRSRRTTGGISTSPTFGSPHTRRSRAAYR